MRSSGCFEVETDGVEINGDEFSSDEMQEIHGVWEKWQCCRKKESFHS